MYFFDRICYIFIQAVSVILRELTNFAFESKFSKIPCCTVLCNWTLGMESFRTLLTSHETRLEFNIFFILAAINMVMICYILTKTLSRKIRLIPKDLYLQINNKLINIETSIFLKHITHVKS